MRCLIPKSFIDASDMRQVPDNQEVFVDSGALPGKDISVVVELTDPIDLTEAITLPGNVVTLDQPHTRAVAHFAALASDNTAAVAEVISSGTLRSQVVGEGAVVAETVIGYQAVAKFGKRSGTLKVRVALSCTHLTLPHDVDILISINCPVFEEEPSDDELDRTLQAITASLKLDDPTLFG
ncbi:hypothetical protein PYCC9005_003439 [Savitreella phatthalungensis]